MSRTPRAFIEALRFGIASRIGAWRRVSTLAVLLLLGTAGPASASHGPRNITALAIDPLTPTTLYAGTSDRGVLKSVDGGATWSATDLTSAWITALAIDPLTSTTLYTGTSDRGVLKSTDGGTGWTATGVVGALLIDPGAASTLYAVIAGKGAFKSENAGADWHPISPTNDLVRALALDLLTPTIIYTGVADGVYESIDGGTNWRPIGLTGHAVSSLASYPPSLYAVSQHGTFETTGGGVWTLTDTVPSAMVPMTPTALYAGTASGAFKSVDGGETWTAVNTGLTDVLLAHGVATDVGPLAIDPATPDTLYAATDLGVFKSRDGGATWQHLLPEYLATVPASVKVAAGATTATFLVATHPVISSTAVTISATAGGVSRSAQLTVRPRRTLSSLVLNPTTVRGGATSIGEVTLNVPAAASGAHVTLSSSKGGIASVPLGITVPAGATSAKFKVSTRTVTSSRTVTISAQFGGVTRSATITLTP